MYFKIMVDYIKVKRCLVLVLFASSFTIQVFSQGEFVIEKYNGRQDVFFKSKGCTPEDGVIVFYTEFSNLKFNMPDTPKRLRNISAFDKERNCYVLCIQPTDNGIGEILKYSIDITSEGYIPATIDVKDVRSVDTQYFTIKLKATSLSPIAKNIYKDVKSNVLIAHFSNESAYAKGFFYDKENDPIGKQVVNILSAKLNSTNDLFSTISQLDDEGTNQEKLLADCRKDGMSYLIMGTVTEYGRKNENEKGKKYQIVDVGISIRLVEVSTGQTIYSEEAKGEAKTDGKKTDYDATLNDKAISDASSKLIENIVKLFN